MATEAEAADGAEPVPSGAHERGAPGDCRGDERDQLHRALVAAGVGTWHWDATTDVVSWNDELAAIFGVAPAEFPGPRAATRQYVHPDDREYAAARTDEAMKQRSSVRLEYRIVRPDGEVRWVETRATVHTGPDGAATGASGVTFDVSERKAAEAERDRLQARLALLAEVTTTLAASLDADEVLDRLAGLVLPRLCDAVLVDCIDEGLPQAAVIRAVDPDVAALLERAEGAARRRDNPRTAAARTFASGEAVLVRDVTDGYIRDRVGAETAGLYLRAGIVSAVVAPLLARNGVAGIISLYATDRSGRRYDETDADLAVEIGRRAGLALDNARLYAAEHNVAETLQRALLPELPTLPGLEVAARYLPSGGPAQHVGGDWFDVFATPGGGVGFTVGDVAGHDLRAAAAMAHTRSALRAYARDGAPPGAVLDQLDSYVEDFAIAELVTVGYGLLRGSAENGVRTLQWASAGHPPPLLITAAGDLSYLEEATSPPIGALARDSRRHAVVPLHPGDTLLCYTDGLVETRHSDLTEGQAELARAAGRHHSGSTGRLVEGVIADLESRLGDDDVAVLAVRVLEPRVT